ncbi:MAG: C25 family cysteine peptidase [Methanothrix sp.]|nr:C25 family cysteine peptidase [Methanothrix sp.]
MRFLGNGIDYSSGRPFTSTISREIFVDRLGLKGETVKRLTRATTFATTFRSGTEMAVGFDIRDPRKAGWTFLINGQDPRREEVIKSVKTLAEHRGMEDPGSPLIYNGEPPEEWVDWLNANYYWPSALENRPSPYYILILGGPDMVPFHFQSVLDSVASVGRLEFDSPGEIEAYSEKVVRLEGAESPVVSRKAIVFAPDGGYPDATFYSHKYMARPLAGFIQERCGCQVEKIMGEEATKENLIQATSGTNPALVYTASHGVGATSESLSIQHLYNGAICCQESGEDCYFTAKDVPAYEPFLEGSVFFQFACFGYGTPAESDFAYWELDPSLSYKTEPFVAALPRRMIAHPRGPLAFIGHLDVAWLHGFDDPNDPDIQELWHPRMAPFVRAASILLEGLPVGLALVDMNKRYDLYNAKISTLLNGIKRGDVRPEDVAERLADAFINRSDAQNYMVYGDPAARIARMQD